MPLAATLAPVRVGGWGEVGEGSYGVGREENLRRLLVTSPCDSNAVPDGPPTACSFSLPRERLAEGRGLCACPCVLALMGTVCPFALPSLAVEETMRDSSWRLCFKHYGFLDTENVPRDSVEFTLLFEQVRAWIWAMWPGSLRQRAPPHPTLTRQGCISKCPSQWGPSPVSSLRVLCGACSQKAFFFFFFACPCSCGNWSWRG